MNVEYDLKRLSQGQPRIRIARRKGSHSHESPSMTFGGSEVAALRHGESRRKEADTGTFGLLCAKFMRDTTDIALLLFIPPDFAQASGLLRGKVPRPAAGEDFYRCDISRLGAHGALLKGVAETHGLRVFIVHRIPSTPGESFYVGISEKDPATFEFLREEPISATA